MGAAEQRNKDSAHAQWMKNHNVQRTTTTDPLSYQTVSLPYAPRVTNSPGTARSRRRGRDVGTTGRPFQVEVWSTYRAAVRAADASVREEIDYTEYGLREVAPGRFVKYNPPVDRKVDPERGNLALGQSDGVRRDLLTGEVI